MYCLLNNILWRHKVIFYIKTVGNYDNSLDIFKRQHLVVLYRPCLLCTFANIINLPRYLTVDTNFISC